MNKPVGLALVGAGNRGRGIFGQYALEMPHRAKFTAVVEPDKAKREQFVATHCIPAERAFSDYDTFFDAGLGGIDGIIIATLEDHRVQPVVKSMEKRYNILVEKPLCTNAGDLVELYDAAEGYPEILIVCHQMRLTPLYRTIKSLVDSGKYGDIVCVQHSENLSYSHMAHSFVRGVFNSSKLAPMLLAKSCHDLDLLAHIIGKKARRIASFGGLNHFRSVNCPDGAPKFCLEGCRHYQTCPYHVLKLYFEADTDPAYLRQMGIVRDKSHLRELLMKNQFGRCVFQAGNDVVDNQTVQIEFENNIHVSFTMCGHNGVERRMTRISMTNGEIDYDGISGLVKAYSFEPLQEETIRVVAAGTHGGGDRAIMDNFVDAIESGDKSSLLTPIKDSLAGHLMVFAAEESRKTGNIVDLKKYEAGLRAAKRV